MRENLGLKLDMEHEYMIAGKQFHMVEKMTHKALLFIANTTAMVLINKDEVTGVSRENVLMCDPVIIYEMFDVLTDLDMKEYQEMEDDAVLTFYEDARAFAHTCESFERMYESISDAYLTLSYELRRQVAEENSVGALLRGLGKYMNGDGTHKDIGLIRKMLTDLMIKAKKSEAEEKTAEPEKPDNIVDLSMYRVKDEKKNK